MLRRPASLLAAFLVLAGCSIGGAEEPSSDPGRPPSTGATPAVAHELADRLDSTIAYATAPPTTTTTTTVQVEPQVDHGRVRCGGWGELVAAYFPADQVHHACRVMACETGRTFDPAVTNSRSGASGLFQFLGSTWEATTGLPAPASAYPPGKQVAAAATLWQASGWVPWACA